MKRLPYPQSWQQPRLLTAAGAWCCWLACAAATPTTPEAGLDPIRYRLETLERAVQDLARTHGTNYPDAPQYLDRIRSLGTQWASGVPGANADRSVLEDSIAALQREALLATPLLKSAQLLLVKRRPRQVRGGGPGLEIGMPSNHECNSSLSRTGYDNELAILESIRPDGALRSLYRPSDHGYVGEVDLHWDADRILFTKSDATNWKVFEMRVDGSELRPISRMPDDVDSFDACYLPNGRILFGATASFQSVPCWHGQRKVSSLYLMNADGSGVRQVGFDQDHDLHPTVMGTGQVLYNRWDYTGINHIYLRELMLMNPDGTGQRAIYGSGSWFPNSLYFSRPLPGPGGQMLSILSGYHGVHRMGQLVILDTTRGWHEAEGIVQRISGRGDPVRPMVKDNLVDADWPKFLHPFPVSDKQFLVAAWPHAKANWGIYLADVFDNLVLVREEPGWALLEPVLLKSQARPPVLAEQVDLAREDGVVYLHDIYAGPGLKGVPRGTVKDLRVLAYHFGYFGLAGPDRIGYGGPWEVMRILGTVPVESDGSAFFRVPANTPIALQPLDAEGQAVQLMRSWFTVMPGEKASCVGCHESPADTPRLQVAQAATKAPRDLTPWHGPARGFDFEREVQPVLDRHCLKCHDGGSRARSTAEAHATGGHRASPAAPGDAAVSPGLPLGLHAGGETPPALATWDGRLTRDIDARREVETARAVPDLRSGTVVTNYAGRRISQMGIDRLHPRMRADTQGLLKYSPAYDALIPYLRRVGIEDDVSMLTPGEYHADTSPLIQMLRKGHHGVNLDAESWDRLVTWIDLNAPCHGTWGEVYPIPDGAHERRMALRRQFGGPREDPEQVPKTEIQNPKAAQSLKPDLVGVGSTLLNAGSAIPSDLAFRISELPQDPRTRTVDLGNGQTITLVHLPAGEFAMGDADGEPDEHPVRRIRIARPFWMAAFEISNEQFRQFDPNHDSRYYQKRYPPVATGNPGYVGPDARGLTLNGDRQPAVRVSWGQAMAFCGWMSDRTGIRFTLPTEAQWEWACRAHSPTPLSFGTRDIDFSPWANLADASFSKGLGKDGKQVTGGLEHLMLEGAALSDARFNDRSVVTADVGSYQPNAWGLHDLHGNAAEWTRTTYAPEPGAGRDLDSPSASGSRMVVRGGSFFDPPNRARSAFRLAYPAWQRVFNVGFRVVGEDLSTPAIAFK